MSQVQPSRRAVVTGAAALAAAGFVPGLTESAVAATRTRPNRVTLTVLGTTDTHGHVFNWDYFADKEYDDRAHNDVGLAKVSTLVTAMREQRGSAHTLLIDAGDTIQGTPLAYYYAKIDPITDGARHPMAEAMNIMGYDAAALGNHEFNYGIDTLRAFEDQLDFPLLGANAVDPATKRPVFAPYVVKTVRDALGRTVKIGILGLTNPGIAIWDKANVEGRMEFPGLVEQAKVFVPQLKAAGCDVVVVAAHSGAVNGSSYGDALPYPENASSLLAEQVPGIDAILVGHAHQEIAERWVTNAQTGKQVLLTEPYYWGMRLAVITVELQYGDGGWRVVSLGSQLLNANTATEDPEVAKALTAQHDTVVDYVNSPVGTCTTAMYAARAVVEDVPIIDLINKVQGDVVKAGLAGTADGALPVLSIAAPFSRTAVFPQGQVSVRDVAGLYVYDNTLLAVKVTGAQVKDYLEYSVRYFQQVSGTGPFTVADLTNAVTPTAPTGTPDYNYDIVAGLDAPLTYTIDVAAPAGSRIGSLAYAGLPVDPAAEFVLAINNYRQSGGGGFPAVSTAPVVYNRQQEIHQAIIDWVAARGTIDPATFASVDWKLVSGGQDITITD
ncbi:MAG: bifunctional metallophosphatase/5'-nucleotidase [Nocardioidaceae bacterium]